MGGLLSNNDWETAYPAPRAYEFKNGDDEACRESFTALQTWYSDSYPDFTEVEKKKHELEEEIFNKMKEHDIKLVDNIDYVIWATTQANTDFVTDAVGNIKIEDIPSSIMNFGKDVVDGKYIPELDEWTEKFYRSARGAKKIKSEKMLDDALDAMFYYRASLGLEEQREYDDISYAFGDLSSCTRKTRKQGKKLQGYITEGSHEAWDSKEWFIKATLDWMNEQI